MEAKVSLAMLVIEIIQHGPKVLDNGNILFPFEVFEKNSNRSLLFL
jgi:hypothetical protein